MKRIILTLLLGCLLVGGSACHSTPNRTAYVAVGATTASVEASIKAFNIWIASHPLTSAQQQTYANALAAYVNACEAVRAGETAAQGTGTAPASLYAQASATGSALIKFMSDIAPLVIKSSTSTK